MTIVTTTTSSGPYTAVAQTTFAVTFQSAGAGEIEVTLAGVVQSPSLYTFTRADDGTGSVVFTAAVTGQVLIYSKPLFTQDTSFSRFGAFYPDQMNSPFDKAAAKILYLKNLLIPAAFTPTDRASKYAGWDASGNPITTSAAGPKGDPGAPAVTAEQYGAIGYSTAAAAQAGQDNRAAIQAAITALCAAGGGTLVFSKPHYGFAATARAYATDDIVASVSGVGLVIDGAHVTLRSTCGGTNLYRRAVGMANPATWANWPLLSGGGHWRGGGIFLKGQTPSAPANYSSRAGVTLDGVTLQGGILLGASYGPMNLATGDGWDTSDKGIWSDNGRTDSISGIFTTGDIRTINGGGVIGFRGELVYGSNDPATTIYVRNGTFGETNGQCINGNSGRVDIDGMYGYNAAFGFEGWLGDRGNFLNVTFEGVVSGVTIGGGKFGVGTFSTYNNPTRISATVTPYGRIDNLVMKRCGPLLLGAWIKAGTITLIDSRLHFSNGAYADGLFDTHINEVVIITDQINSGAVQFLGADGVTSANQSIRDVKIDRISLLRTKVAVAAARLPSLPVSWYASLGPRIVIGEITGEMSSPPYQAAAWSGFPPNFLRTNIQSWTSYGGASQNVQTTPTLPWLGPFVGVTTTGTGTYPMLLPTTNILDGAELTLRNDGPGQVYIDGNGGGGSGSGMRDSVGPVFLPTTAFTKFRFDGSFWNIASAGARTFTATVANLPAAAAVLQGVRATVTDANATLTAGIGAVVAAGGANKVPVFCDGAAWRIS